MVGLGPAIERRQQVGRVFAHVELVDVAPARGPHPGDQPVVLEADLLAGVEVEIADLDLDAGAGAPFGVVERIVGGDQAAGRSRSSGGADKGRRTIRASRDSCTARDRAPGGRFPGNRGRRRDLASAASSRRGDTEHPGVHLVAFGISRLEVAPVTAGPEEPLDSPAAGTEARRSAPCRNARSDSGGNAHSVISRYEPSGRKTLPRGSELSTARANVVVSIQSRLARSMSQKWIKPAVAYKHDQTFWASSRTSRRRRRRRRSSRGGRPPAPSRTCRSRGAPETGCCNGASRRRGRP